MLQDQLIVVDIGLHPHKEHTGYLLLTGAAEGPAAAGDGDVGGFAPHVLGIADTANFFVELWAAVA